MNSKTQNELQSLYSDWKDKFEKTGIDTVELTPPLLLSDYQPQVEHSKVIVLVGQETLGWSWTKTTRREYPLYPLEYEFSEQTSLQTFLSADDSVGALMWAYEQFDGSEYQPINRRSPF